MTQTLVNRIRPLPARTKSFGQGWLRYGVLLVPRGILTMADAIAGETGDAAKRWGQPPGRKARGPAVFGAGLASSVLGLMSWFLLILLLVAVVRGPFYGFVEPGPYGPGTWGGPSRAGAWAVHAAVAIPIVVLIPFVLRGISLLHSALICRLYGVSTAKWVLPATIAVCASGLLFFWSWIQQL
ncbi:hypothetical protein E1263_14455 [Kribbella antibiotica]|uniref:Yip1 domain-containing protein n=1 Tax=Kribbella antibiotica TaxID=190195 RepID=A0A4R4ZL78_9ACTN|nr:hypothetical protein [Kribbella antibiotica]TDD59548.1 hypothetical protein E1263_14455 [Kribbella antibiotica]